MSLGFEPQRGLSGREALPGDRKPSASDWYELVLAEMDTRTALITFGLLVGGLALWSAFESRPGRGPLGGRRRKRR